jgi:hypothetical protein
VDCRLQDENGEVLEGFSDPSGAIAASIPPLSDEGSPCWRFIDPYGDTVFNRLQMGPFLLEVDALQRRAGSQHAAVLGKVEALARRCRDEVHLYLKFVGD